MNLICEANGIVDFQRPGQGAGDILSAGFKNVSVDIMKSYKPEEKKKIENLFSDFEADNEILKNVSGYVLDKFRTLGINIFSIRAPRVPLKNNNADYNTTQMKMTEETIRICGEYNCEYVIVSPVVAKVSKGDQSKINTDFYLSLAETAKKKNVTVLIENQCRYYNGQLMRGMFSDSCEAARFIDLLNEKSGDKRFGFCLNINNCNMCGMDVHSFAVKLGKRIKAVVISDCDGQNESHMLPFTAVGNGQLTDWLSVIRGLREAEFDGGIIIDMADTAASFSPILRPQLVSMAESVGSYFRWQIEIEMMLKKYKKRVLFGAGNMCRNYMKCYGEKYPPLFTCDNNSKTWGTDFCGLEVKSPDAIKDIPSDCAIFICTIYYREIEQQLREMGVTNPIEYFNDEYMPSFYFDRLEMK